MADSVDSLTREELIEYVEKLQKVLEEDENEIARLTRENEVLVRNRIGKDVDPSTVEISEFIAQIDELKAKQEQDQIDLAKFRDQLTDSKARYSLLLNDKVDLENRVKVQSKRIEELEKELLNVTNLTKNAAQQSQEFSKLKSDTNKETIRLLREIEILKESNEDNGELVAKLNEEKSILEEALHKISEEKEELTLYKESITFTINEFKSKIKELEIVIEYKQQECDTAEESLIQLRQESGNKHDEDRKVILQLSEKLKITKSENDELKQKLQIASSSEKDRPLTMANQINESNSSLIEVIEELHLQLQDVMTERDKLAGRIVETEDNIEKIVLDRVTHEKERVLLLEKQLDHVKARLEESQTLHVADDERSILQNEIEELSNWKAVYEAGHGMQELSRNQKKLKDHNRRLEIAVDQMNAKISLLMDANGILSQAFDKLRHEAGKDPSFMYSEFQLKEEMLNDKVKLSAQVKELEAQVDSLESDNIRLRKALKDNAGSLGEKSLDQLRDSTIDSIVASRSTDLLIANKRLKDDIKLLTLQLQHYERDSANPTAMDAITKGAEENEYKREIMILREELNKLFKYLRVKAAAHYDEDVTENISALLLAHNEALMKEIEELRKWQLRQDSRVRAQMNTEANRGPSSKELTQSTADIREPRQISSSNKQLKSSIELTSRHKLESEPKESIQASNYGKFVDVDVKNTDLAKLSPSTIHGSILLRKNLSIFSLPPEEWTEDFRNIHAQFIECLEQLYDREKEVEEQGLIIASFEDHLVSVKQQVSGLYYDFIKRSSTWESREKECRNEIGKLRDENEDLKLKMKRINELLSVKRNGTVETLESKLYDLTKRISIHEVNENILSRKYVSKSEQLAAEQELRRKLEIDIADLESSLKKRILYLEQYKHSASAKLEFLQSKLNEAVPSSDYLSLQRELDLLRDDHLNTLQREVNARVLALNGQEHLQELRSLRLRVIELESQFINDRETIASLKMEITNQQSVTSGLMSAAKISNDVSSLVSEIAIHRGEVSRLDVELTSSKKKNELMDSLANKLSKENEDLQSKLIDLQSKQDDLLNVESSSERELVKLKHKYENGLTRDEADDLRGQVEKLKLSLDSCEREKSKYQEIADIASKQAQTVSLCKQDYMDTIKELQEYCAKLESRGDDDILIGRLQRQLMSMKTSYKAFVRKYQLLLGNMKQRELGFRILESRLDQKDEVAMKIQESYRSDLRALKLALRKVYDTFDGDSQNISPSKKHDIDVKSIKAIKTSGKSRVPVSHKLTILSTKVKELSNLAERAIVRKLEGELARKKLESQIEELLCDKDILEQRLSDFDMMLKGKVRLETVAARIKSLGEEVKSTKLVYMQQKRQIQRLRQEKSHLESVIATMETDVETLEEMNARSEIKNLMTSIDLSEGKPTEFIENFDSTSVYKLYNKIGLPNKQTTDLSKAIPTVANKIESEYLMNARVNSNETLDHHEDLINQLDSVNVRLNEKSRELSECKVLNEKLRSKLVSLETELKEKLDNLNYYEQVVAAEGLPLLSGGASEKNSFSKKSFSSKISADEQEKLQEAATATIHSLRSLIDEKNKMIERYREKIEELQSERNRKKSKADQNAEDLLSRLTEEDNRDENQTPIGQMSELSKGNSNEKLLTQLEQADELIVEKTLMINQLEQQLAKTLLQKERAEIRCGESIKEMETMREDMLRLTRQLQLSEERFRSFLPMPPTSYRPELVEQQKSSESVHGHEMNVNNAFHDQELKLKELSRLIKSKDDKIKGYRDIIVRLKEEFIKSEEEKALVVLSSKRKERGIYQNDVTMTTDEMKQLKGQVSALKAGLQQAKDDLEKARVVREKAAKAKQADLEDLRKLEEKVRNLQNELRIVEDAKEKFKKDVEDARKRENRLREKLKDTLDLGFVGKEKYDLKAMLSRQETLEREIATLKAQNAALRGTKETDKEESKFAENDSSHRLIETGSSSMPGKGRILGSDNQEKSNTEQVRHQLHMKWENEKKMQKRIETLEIRLRDQIAQNEVLQQQLATSKDTIDRMVKNKDGNIKKIDNAKELSMRKTENVLTTEEANGKYFALEEENAILRRKIEVDFRNEMTELRHQINVYKNQIVEYEREIEIYAMRLKSDDSSYRNDGGKEKSLRESEHRFLREEQLKDEITMLKRQRLDLEGALLDRDSKAVSYKFDLAAQEDEKSRLRRRIYELELAMTKLSTKNNLSSGTDGGYVIPSRIITDSGSKLNSKRERDLETTVGALRQVIDKMKTENERLRRQSSVKLDDENMMEEKIPKVVTVEKRRLLKLEEENKDLQTKAKNYDDILTRLNQRQQQVANLRKQLKSKEDENGHFRSTISNLNKEKEELLSKLTSAESRIQQLESSLCQTSSKLFNTGTKKKSLSHHEFIELEKIRDENALLKEVLSEKEGILVKLKERSEETKTSNSALAKLEEENRKLKAELSAFDMEFFDEIENLKFEHSEAIRKLRLYKKTYGEII